MKTSEIVLDFRPKSLRASNYIGKFKDRTDVTNISHLPDLTIQIAFLNKFFYKNPDAFFIRISAATRFPEDVYKNLTFQLRKANKSRWNREPVSGFRLCNVQKIAHAWRFVSNVACTGSLYSSVLFNALRRSIFLGRPTFYVSFRTPRRTQYDREYKRYYAEFYERSHLLRSQVRITMLEPYYWRIECNEPTSNFVVQILFDIFGSRLQTLYTDPLNGIEITQSPNIDSDDYFTTERHLLHRRIRFFQPFGQFYNLLKNHTSQ